MQYRNMGDSDLRVSSIGFGGWPMGQGHYGSFDEAKVTRAIHAAIDLGITLFDTAAGYGWGQGEKLLGSALNGKRDAVVLTSKGGINLASQSFRRSDRDSSRDNLAHDLENSLRSLQTDYLDLYLIHWPDTSRPYSEPMEALADFQKQGKIRYGGVSNFNVEQMSDSLSSFPIVCNQVGYHLFDFRIEDDIMPFCTTQGLGLMGYGSLAHGLLSGTMSPHTRFDDSDWRAHPHPFSERLFEPDRFLNNLEKVEILKEVAESKGKTVAQLALSWVVSNPAISVALVGIRHPSEIEENIGAADWVMTDAEREEIRAIVRS